MRPVFGDMAFAFLRRDRPLNTRTERCTFLALSTLSRFVSPMSIAAGAREIASPLAAMYFCQLARGNRRLYVVYKQQAGRRNEREIRIFGMDLRLWHERLAVGTQGKFFGRFSYEKRWYG